ncbi:MAG: response regulator [Acidobacteria bacterium]|nr:response regulator [Acidobacteriota bacterium]
MEKILSILVVDDDLIIGKTITKMLNNKSFISNSLEVVKFAVEIAEIGTIAIKMLEEKDFDIVICDIEMPGIDGIKLCQITRKMEKYKTTPFIFISSYKDIEVRLEALSVGGNDYISKPFSVEELLIRIKKLISSKNDTSLSKDFYTPLAQTSLKQKIELIVKYQLSGTLKMCFKDFSDAKIEFFEGKIVEARWAELEAEEAVRNILSRSVITYSFDGKSVSDKGIINSSIIKLIKET